MLAEAGITTIAPLDDPDRIALLMQGFVSAPTQGTLATAGAIADASRQARTCHFAALLDGIIAA